MPSEPSAGAFRPRQGAAHFGTSVCGSPSHRATSCGRRATRARRSVRMAPPRCARRCGEIGELGRSRRPAKTEYSDPGRCRPPDRDGAIAAGATTDEGSMRNPFIAGPTRRRERYLRLRSRADRQRQGRHMRCVHGRFYPRPRGNDWKAAGVRRASAETAPRPAIAGATACPKRSGTIRVRSKAMRCLEAPREHEIGDGATVLRRAGSSLSGAA